MKQKKETLYNAVFLNKIAKFVKNIFIEEMAESPTNSEENARWYVMRVTYQRELIAKKILDESGIESFVPMRTTKKLLSNGRTTQKKESALHNYIFIHSTKESIDDIKLHRIPWLRYVIHNVDGGERRKMRVPDKQMYDFIAIAGSDDEKITYLSHDEVALAVGDMVRITNGPFKGIEGKFIKLKNVRGKSVVVRIDGLTAVATATIPARFVEKISETEN